MQSDALSPLDSYTTLNDILRARAFARPDDVLYHFLATGDVDGPVETWSYGRLDHAARAVAAALQGAGIQGGRALLLFPPSLDFVAALMGCLYAGTAAVPTYPPDPGRLDRTLPRLRAIARDSRAQVVLTTAPIKAMAEMLLPQVPELAELVWIAVDALPPSSADAFHPVAIGAETIAILQYTSGSTGAPKGVVLTHANVLHNERLIQRGFGHDAQSTAVVGWLPLFHDMGLIGNVLQPLYHGIPCILMSPIAFLQRPQRWLEAISRYGASTSGGPNFAYELCARKVPNEVLERLDLRSWKVAFNGAEPLQADTLRRFAERFAPCGFRPEAFYPCYGLAEATLFVAGARPSEGARTRTLDAAALAQGRAVEVASAHPEARAMVSSGWLGEGMRAVIVDPHTREPRAEGGVGEIWLEGPSVASGYWGRDEETAATFDARLASGEGPFLRTGDLGFLAEGELFVTGRQKDLIILRGRNVYPQDVELTAEQTHAAVRPGCVAAFGLEVGGEERLALVAEVEPARVGGSMESVMEAIRRAVADEHAAHLHLIALLAPRSIHKTSSGKIQRRACKQALLAGALEVLGRSDAPEAPEDAPAMEDVREALARAPEDTHGALLERALRAAVARRTGSDAGALDVAVPLASLGLDSLAGLELQEELEVALGVRLPATFLWQSATIHDAASELLGAWRHASTQVAPTDDIPARDPSSPEEPSPLSPGQFRLWFLERLMPGVPLYNVQFGLRMRGPLVATALEGALDALVERHAILRTVIREVEGQPCQVVLPAAKLTLAHVDLAGEPAATRDAAREQHALAEGRTIFDLQQGPLLRASLVRLAEDEHELLLTQHHIITDGWSISILARELSALYQARLTGADASLPPVRVQYADYARWQIARRSTLAAQREFWAERLRALPRLELPTDQPRPREPKLAGATTHFTLPRPLVEGLRALGRRHGCTLYVTLLAAYAALLHRYTGQTDFGVGTVSAQRDRAATRSLVGFLANTLTIRCDLDEEPTFEALMQRTRARVEEALRHAELPFEDVVAATQAARGADQNPLFQVNFMLEQLPAVETRVPGMSWEPALRTPDGAVAGTAKFDLSLAMVETPSGLDGALEYRSDLFREDTIQRFAGHLEVLLRAAVASPERRVRDLPILTEAERQRVLNGTCAGAWRGDAGLVHAQFQAQAARTPGATAVVFEGASLTYAELDRRARSLSARLRELGVAPDVRVGVLVERSLDVVVAMLGILGAGGAYVPLDPSYPLERLRHMVHDASVGVLVTQAHLTGMLAGAGCVELRVEDLEHVAAPPEASPPAHDPAQLAYVIYTSGSTGKPKGVMLPHATVTRFFAAMDERLGAEPPGTWLAVTSVSFDISVLELLWTLCRGFTVVIQADEASTLRAERRRGRANPIDFSLFYFADDADGPGRDRYRLLLDGARFADRNGFSAVWTPERHFHAFGGMYPNPSVTSAALSTITERVGLRAGSVVIPLHHPVRVAEEWAVVDNLSRGRVGLSVASGWHADDFVFAPERYAARKDVMLEGLDVIRRLWRGEVVRLPGGDGKPVDVRIRPRPVQAELPIWMTAAGNPETFRVAGALGASVLTHLLGQSIEELTEKIALYREAYRGSGASGRGHVTLMLHTYVDPDLSRVRARVEAPFKNYLRSSLDLMKGIGRSLGMSVDTGPLGKDDVDRIVEHAFGRYFETSGLFGTPRGSLELVEQLRAMGVDEIACLVDFGIDTDAVLESLPHLDQLRRLSEREARRGGGEPVTVPRQIKRYGVTHLQCTPSMARALLLDVEAREALGGLQKLLVGGEAFPGPLAEELGAIVPAGRMNMYGPTETTIWSATHDVKDERGGVVPLGTPLAHNRVYVLDRALQPVPFGVPGEIYIGGDCVARGYHGRPALTAERFLPDPFRDEPGARIYRTGDIGRLRADGTLEFLGRADQQVKLRGFRIELGEVEASLATCPGVREAVAAVREDVPLDVRLVAYVVPAEGKIDPASLRASLQRRLPDYMVPSVFVELPAIPRTPNGKVDRKALPAPSEERRASAAFVAPRSDVEQQIADVWRRVLRVDQVGVHDNFFDLGGHSLLMVQVHNELQPLRPDMPLVKLLEHPTVSALAAYLSEGAEESAAVVDAAQDRARRQLEVLKRQRKRARG
ncbi:MupA/Atu3671 family FMN-dependent luciferase-like monooxygenase [Polyangium sp. 6x1]|uniref:MupA/Atu3671 family FMN-dependent luciferase-like monooxygenase n=1 Tax=Polyangium sp. 6x1 TaxID=3042689 RepID=UPI002482A4A6|nr:MupA/Atu3671 family FMN-dependent luciferase-like monooxygenase [Polyangium sp. 6x1]MDI1443036.1 LLM class flavin-dependent oxidoreductase [Polyangium sp. 6x1]